MVTTWLNPKTLRWHQGEGGVIAKWFQVNVTADGPLSVQWENDRYLVEVVDFGTDRNVLVWRKLGEERAEVGYEEDTLDVFRQMVVKYQDKG